MNEIVNKFLLTVDKYMPKLYLRLLIALVDRLTSIMKGF